MFFLIVAEDIKLNSTVFHWPEQIEIIFENSRAQLFSRRDHAEVSLVKRYAITIGHSLELGV